MRTATLRRGRRPKARQDAPKRKNYRLRQSKLDAARRVLGTTTDSVPAALAGRGFETSRPI